MKVYCLQVGKSLIRDIMNPCPGQIDLRAIEDRLRIMHRWSNDPRALTVHQHRHLVALLAQEMNEREEVIDWCLHHDDHEAITGDIPGPIKSLISYETNVLHRIEDGLDRAICAARGRAYPARSTRELVHQYDKAAETVEWLWVFGNAPAPWNKPMPPISEDRLKELLQLARIQP